MLSVLHGIWVNAPVWIWPLFALLLYVGVRALRPRRLPLWLFYVLPAFSLLSIRPIQGLSYAPLGWMTFSAACGAGAVLFFHVQSRIITARTPRSVSVRGEGYTLGALMALFAANVASGAIHDIAPQQAATIPFTAGFAALTGLCSGSFLGRTLRVLTVPNH